MKNPLWFVWVAAVCTLLASGEVVTAADSTWTGSTNALWSATTNWNPSAPTSADRAIFDGLGNGNTTLDLETGATIAQILFDTANAAAYTLGTSGSQSLTLATGGTIAVGSTVVSNQSIAAGLRLGDGSAGTFTLTNASTTNTLLLSGAISGGSGGTAAAQTLVVAGAGNTTISGNLANGGATTLGLTKQGTGTLTLSGTNNAATGDIAGELEDPGSLGTPTAQIGIGLRPPSQDARDTGDGEDVVDQRGRAEQSRHCRQGRFGPDHAASTLDALQHRGLLTADV